MYELGYVNERDIHDIIKTYPYLVEEGLQNYKLKHEYIYEDRTRADFIFDNGDQCIVVEIKKDLINVDAYLQSMHYLKNENKKNPNKKIKCILIGFNISKDVIVLIEKSEYIFEVKLLDIDIPIKIKICDKCRKANSILNIICQYCKSKKFITDPFIYY